MKKNIAWKNIKTPGATKLPNTAFGSADRDSTIILIIFSVWPPNNQNPWGTKSNVETQAIQFPGKENITTVCGLNDENKSPIYLIWVIVFFSKIKPSLASFRCFSL